MHRQELEDLARQITETRKIARRLDRSRRYSRRTVAHLLDAVWQVTTEAEIVTGSLAIHLAGYRSEKRSGRAAQR